ncbi:MAG: hypothetical protein P4L85_19510 [Paludisphaera borealis]|uniref:hypothetical protein n=1 Tax=Paludisphaera borealis TaxID=1387353 RepID=UPI00284ABC52|nr:hypothetical protein [Paludisphaera borealis]MDR3621548.1 hypothetical protein [Paludisphaera borealis]
MSVAIPFDEQQSTLSVGELCLLLRRIGKPWPSIAKRYHMTVAAAQAAVALAEADHGEALAARRPAKQVCAAIFAKSTTRALGGSIDADQQEGWLLLRRAGWHPADIADDAETTVHAVLVGLQAAQNREMDRKAGGEHVDLRAFLTTPLYGVRPFVPTSPCPHRGPLKQGSSEYCEQCSRHGKDGHWRLRRDPARDPRPEPKPKPTPIVEFSRFERRRLKFAAAEADRAKKLLRSLGG